MVRTEDPQFLFLTIIGEQSKNDRKEHPQPQRSYTPQIHTGMPWDLSHVKVSIANNCVALEGSSSTTPNTQYLTGNP